MQVLQYLRSKKWDTRVAAAHAIGSIAENVKHMSLTELSRCVEAKMLEGGISATFNEVVDLPNWHSRTGSGTSFKRLGTSFKRFFYLCSSYLFCCFLLSLNCSLSNFYTVYLTGFAIP